MYGVSKQARNCETLTFAESDAYFKTFWNPYMYMYGWYVKFT